MTEPTQVYHTAILYIILLWDSKNAPSIKMKLICNNLGHKCETLFCFKVIRIVWNFDSIIYVVALLMK